jgi:hypothetical protein
MLTNRDNSRAPFAVGLERFCARTKKGFVDDGIPGRGSHAVR